MSFPGGERAAAFVSRVDADSREPLLALAAVMPADFGDLPPQRRRALAAAHAPRLDEPADVDWEDRVVPGAEGDPPTSIRVYRPRGVDGDPPAVLHLHGGGMWAGSVEEDHAAMARLAAEVGAVVVSVAYRLAPEHPYPAALADALAALRALHAGRIGVAVDPARVCVHGPSAGGGLALAVALAAREQRLPIALVMALYPMVDDRAETASAREFSGLGPPIWDREANQEAWAWYLGGSPADHLAAPARASDLTGLPPTFIDVGTLDLFRDEDVALAGRLLGAGVPVELHVHPGAFHGSEVVAPDADLSRRIVRARREALLRVLHPPAHAEREERA